MYLWIMGTMSPKDFGKKLKAYRVKRGWTQRKLAEEIHVSRITVARAEAGRRLADRIVGKIQTAIQVMGGF